MAGKKGGARPGAGRPPTARTVKETALDVITHRRDSGGIMPLQLMFEAMDIVRKENGAVAAFPLAQAIAPFVHPKVSSVELTGRDGGPIESASVYTGFDGLAQLMSAGLEQAKK